MARGSTSSGAGNLSTSTRLAAILAATFTVSLALAVQPGISPAEAACPHVTAHPRQVSLSKLRKAMVCLINKKRERRDRHELSPNRKLLRAAGQHNQVMLENDCFSHRCPGERGLNRRVRRASYTEGWRAWRLGEDLGFDNTPRQMLKRLLRSRYNRRNLLRRSFRDIGVGVGWGAPKEGVDDSKFETFTIVFAWRRGRR